MSFRRYDKFDIYIGNPVEDHIAKQIDNEPPDDPLDEYNEFEMGLRLFCYEQNHYVVLEIGDQRVDDLAFHRNIISTLGSSIERFFAQLESGHKKYIYFGEPIFGMFGESTTLGLTPNKDKMIVELNEQVYTPKYSECIQKLKNFFAEVLKMAIDKGYIKTEDVEKEMGWKLY